MAKIPDDIRGGLEKLAKKVDVPVKTLVERMKEIMEEDKEFIPKTEKDKEFKIRIAWAVLLREYSTMGNAVDCYIMPIMTPRANQRMVKGEKTWVGDITALVQVLNKDEDGNVIKGDIQYAHGTFWRDGAKNMLKMKKGKVYKTQLNVNENKWGLSISTDRASFTPVDDVKPFDFAKFFEEEIRVRDILIQLGELDLTESDFNTDIKLVYATVIEAGVGESQDGNTYGYYTVVDDSILGSNMRFFVAPEDVTWRAGSVLYFGGIVQRDSSDNPVFRVQFIHPTEMAVPMEYDIASPGKQETLDEIDVDTESKVSDKEEKKEEVKEVQTESAKPEVTDGDIYEI